jgi:hypothetical protein
MMGIQPDHLKQISNTVLITTFGSKTRHVRPCKEAVFVEFWILGDFECSASVDGHLFRPIILYVNVVSLLICIISVSVMKGEK